MKQDCHFENESTGLLPVDEVGELVGFQSCWLLLFLSEDTFAGSSRRQTWNCISRCIYPQRYIYIYIAFSKNKLLRKCQTCSKKTTIETTEFRIASNPTLWFTNIQWHITFFNRTYIFKGSIFQPAMLDYRSVPLSKTPTPFSFRKLRTPQVAGNLCSPDFILGSIAQGYGDSACHQLFQRSCGFCRQKIMVAMWKIPLGQGSPALTAWSSVHHLEWV